MKVDLDRDRLQVVSEQLAAADRKVLELQRTLERERRESREERVEWLRRLDSIDRKLGEREGDGGGADLTIRIQELEQANRDLVDSQNDAHDGYAREVDGFKHRIAELEGDLKVANTQAADAQALWKGTLSERDALRTELDEERRLRTVAVQQHDQWKASWEECRAELDRLRAASKHPLSALEATRCIEDGATVRDKDGDFWKMVDGRIRSAQFESAIIIELSPNHGPYTLLAVDVVEPAAPASDASGYREATDSTTHDKATCDCEACENARAAEESHAGTQPDAEASNV